MWNICPVSMYTSVGHDPLCNGLIQHAHVERVVRVQGTLGLTGGAAGVENQHRVIPGDSGRGRGFRIARRGDQLLVVAVSGSGENQLLRGYSWPWRD